MTRRSLFKAAAAAFAGSVLAKLPLAGALPAVPGTFPSVRRFYTGIKGRIEEGPDGQWRVFPDLTMNSDDRSPTRLGDPWTQFQRMICDEIKDYPHEKADLNDPMFNPIDLGPAK